MKLQAFVKLSVTAEEDLNNDNFRESIIVSDFIKDTIDLEHSGYDDFQIEEVLFDGKVLTDDDLNLTIKELKDKK